MTRIALTKTAFLTLALSLGTVACMAQRTAQAEGGKPNIDIAVQEPVTCSKLGPDSNRTLDEASIYTEFYKQKNYEAAFPHWRYVYDNAPGYHEAVHTNGMVIYKHFIDNETDSLKREVLIDTLMALYDKRIDCFGRACFNLGRKGYDLMKYRPREFDAIYEAYEAALDECGLEPEYFILYPYIRVKVFKYRKGEITKEAMFETYERMAAINEHNSKGEQKADYQSTFESIVDEMRNAGIITCDNLREFYGNMYKKDPDNPAVWKKVSLALEGCNTCEKEFLDMDKKLFELEPTARLAISIVNCEIRIGSRAVALRYIDRALELEKDPEQKAKLAYNGARILFDQKDFVRARQYAYKALEFKPNYGEAYILIGTMYISSGQQCKEEDPFYGWAVSWVGVDKFEQARRVDPSVAKEAGDLIAKYAEFFPPREQLFERDIAVDSDYTVKCWINETTKARPKAQ